MNNEMEDFKSSLKSNRLTFPVAPSRPSRSTPIPSEDCCLIRCCGFACTYNHDNRNACCNWCGVIVGVLFLLLAILATLSWYSGIPIVTKYLQSNNDIKHAGPFVIGGLGFFAICSFACGIYHKYFKPRNEPTYSELLALHETVSNQANYGASDSTSTSNSQQSATARSFSCSSGQDTTSSSLASQ